MALLKALLGLTQGFWTKYLPMALVPNLLSMAKYTLYEFALSGLDQLGGSSSSNLHVNNQPFGAVLGKQNSWCFLSF